MSIGQAPTTGLASNRNDPDGPYDPTVTVLSVQAESGSHLAVAVHWACHPTTLGAESLRISADFPGSLRTKLGSYLAPAATPILYLNGAAGDVSEIHPKGSDSG